MQTSVGLKRSAVSILFAATFVSVPTFAAEPEWWTEFKRDCRAQGGTISDYYNTAQAEGGCRLPNRPSNPSASTPSRAQEDADAERQRQQQEETDRIERDRVAAEKRKKEEQQAKFFRERDEMARTLHGSSGPTTSSLKGASGMDSYGLKGSSTANTGLKELRGSDQVTRELHGPQVAWQQLHCAAEIAGFALAALGQRGDYGEFGALSTEALKSLDGQHIDVVCTAAPPFPDLHRRAMDFEQGTQAQRTILSRARVIAERMKQRGDQPTVSPSPAQTATETSEEKLRRVQREVNQANSLKIIGKTQHDIDQQERDRKELATLILANQALAVC